MTCEHSKAATFVSNPVEALENEMKTSCKTYQLVNYGDGTGFMHRGEFYYLNP